MKEFQLAISTQNSYSRVERQTYMTDRTSTAEVAPGKGSQAVNQKPVEQPKAPEQKLTNKKTVAKTEKEDVNAKKGLEEFIRAKMAEKSAKEGAKAPQSVAPVSADKVVNQPQTGDATIAIKTYFSETPSNSTIFNYMMDFYREAEEQGGTVASVSLPSLENLETSFLTRHYLRMRIQAEEMELPFDFLDNIQSVLSKRGIDVDQLVYLTKVKYDWYQRFTPEQLLNPDTRSTIEVAVRLGLSPQQVTSQGPQQRSAREVVVNALLSDEDRLAKAQKLLGNITLSEEQKKALLKAHHLPTEKGGVYRYTEEEIAQKARILKGEDEKPLFTSEQRRILLEAGIAAEPIRDTFTEPVLQDVVREINEEVARETARAREPGARVDVDQEVINEQLRRIRDLRDRGAVNAAEARQLINRLSTWRAESKQAEEDRIARAERTRAERVGFYLRPQDYADLREDPNKWLDRRFDTLYKVAQEGQELTSPVVDNLQRAYSEALTFLEHAATPETLQNFVTNFQIRFNLLSMRTSIAYRSIEGIQRAAPALGAHGLFYGMSLEDGKVNAMFSRLQEVTEDERLKSRLGHLTPETAHLVQNNVIQEQWQMSRQGISSFGNVSDIPDIVTDRIDEIMNKNPADMTTEEKRVFQVRSDIIRSVRTAYDVFVSSQRQAVIVARGRRLTGADAYFSDPGSGVLNVYNLEDLLIEKFDIYTAEDQEFVRRIKLDMAEDNIRQRRKEGEKALSLTESQKEDLGKRLFRDLFAVPDLFSSGWRIKAILGAIDERISRLPNADQEGHRAEDFALFLRLRTPDLGNRETVYREMIWHKIAKFRPEEMVRLFQDRAKDDPRLQALFNNPIFRANGVANYNQFKEKFGSIIRLLRENGFREFRQLNIGERGFNQDEISKMTAYFEGEDKSRQIQEMYRQMTKFAQDSVKYLVGKERDDRFEDIYTRTITVDDALLGELEKTGLRDKDGRVIIGDGTFVPISKKIADQAGADSLVRVWNDTANAVKAGQSLVAFLTTENVEERYKAAEEFAESTSAYNGRKARAECIRFTIGTHLYLSRAPLLFDALGVSKLPLRIPMSEIEKIYGPQAEPLSSDELRKQLDHIRLKLVASMSKETEADEEEIEKIRNKQGDGAAEAYRQNQRKERTEKAEKFYKDMEKLLDVGFQGLATRRGISFLFFLIFAALVEAYELSQIKKLTGGK